jgi:hypothetical protein
MYISLTIFLFRSGIAFYFHLFSTVQVTVRPTKKNVCLRSHVKKNLGSVGIHFFFLLSEIVVPESDSGISFSKFPVSRHLLRCNTTKEFSIAFYVKLKKIELSYRIHLKFNLSDTHISWKGYSIGSLIPKINIHLMAYKKKQTVRRCLRSKILLSLSI